MVAWRGRAAGAVMFLMMGASRGAAQVPALRPYVHGGIGVGRFVFLCQGCGPSTTEMVPSASVGLSLTRPGIDLGLDALTWWSIGDRYTVLTAGTTLRPRRWPVFLGAGFGLAFRQYPQVCNLCAEPVGGGATSRAPARSSTIDPAGMIQAGVRLSLSRRVGLEPFAQYSRLGRGAVASAPTDHLAIGIRLDGR